MRTSARFHVWKVFLRSFLAENIYRLHDVCYLLLKNDASVKLPNISADQIEKDVCVRVCVFSAFKLVIVRSPMWTDTWIIITTVLLN